MTVTTGARFALQVDPASVDLAALRLQGLADRLTEVAADLTEDFTTISRADWSGAARNSMTVEIARLGSVVSGFPQRFSDAAAALTALAAQMREAQALVERANRDWEQSQADYAAAERRALNEYRTTVQDLVSGVGPSVLAAQRAEAAGARDAALHRAASVRDVTDSYTARAVEGAVAALEDEARRAAAVLAGAVLPGVVSSPNGPDGGLMPPVDLAALLGLTATEQRYREHWDDFASAQEAEQAGRDAAERLRSLDVADIDQAAVDALTRYAVNPAFARGLYDELGATGVTQLPWGWANWFTPGAIDPFGGDPAARERSLERLDQVADGLAVVLVTLSHDPSRPQTAQEPVAAATDEGNRGAAYGLSLLLSRAEGMDTAAARTIAVGIYDAERSADVSPFWRPMADTGQGWPPTIFGTDRWYDPMVGVEELLARDPGLAQEFLLGADGHGGTSRTAYLFGERTTRADDGDALGRLLVAATQARDSGPEGSSPGWRSAEVLSQALTAMRQEDGAFRVPDSARDSVGIALANHFPELQLGLVARDTGPYDITAGTVPPAHGEHRDWGPMLGNYDARRLLDAIIDDDTAFTAITAAQEVYLRDAVNRELAAGAHDLSDEELSAQLKAVLQSNARSYGVILDAANLANIADAKDEDERRALLLDVAESVTGLYDFPGSDGVRGLSRLAIEQIIDSVYAPDRPTVSSGAEGQARLDADDVWQQTTAGVSDSVVGALFEQGYFSEGGRWADLAPSVMLDLSPDQVFVRADGSLVPPLEMTDDQHIAYTAWLNHQDSAVFANLLRDSVEPQFAAAASRYQS